MIAPLVPCPPALGHPSTGGVGVPPARVTCRRLRGSRASWLALILAAGTAVGQTTPPAAIAPPTLPPPAQQLPSLLSALLGVKPHAVQSGAPEADPDPAATLPPQIAATEDGRLDLHVRNMEITTALELLSYQARANIVTSTSVKGQLSANLYALTLDQALDALLRPNKFAYRHLNGAVFVGTPEEVAALQPATTRVFPLQHLPPAEAAAAVKAVLGPEAVVVEGGGQNKGSGGGGAGGTSGGSGTSEDMGSAGIDYLIVTDREDRLVLVEQILAEIDRRPRQVLIEATVLRATLTEQNQFGIDFSFLGGVDFQNVNSTSNASADLTTGALPQRKLQDTTFNFNTNFGGMANNGGFSFGLIKNNIGAFLRALEQVTDVVVVANPKLVALNKQEAEVIVGRRDGYLTTMVTQTAAVQKVEFLETGTQIRFRPVINADGTVRLLVRPKDSNGGLTSANLPFEETTEAHADILVPDGDTVLIGGMFRERSVNSRNQIPVLGNVPGLGLLFGNRNDQTTREEVIILLTVHVLKNDERERREFRELANDVERIRVGNRRGLLGTGRERLAQALYQEALHQLEEGHRDLALLDVRMTLNNQPKHLAAIKLYERLLGERVWDDDGSRMHTLIWDLIPPAPGTAPEALFGHPRVALPPPPDPAPDCNDDHEETNR